MKTQTKPPPRGGAPRSRKLNDILEAASKLFLEQGYGATSMDEIALRASVSKRTVYDKFENKQILYAAVIQSFCERTQPPKFLINEEEHDIEAMLTRFGTWFLTEIYSPMQINLLQTVVNDARQFPEIGKLMMEPFRRTQTALAGYLAAQSKKGNLNIKDPWTTAAIFVAMLKSDTQFMLLFGQSRTTVQRDVQRNVKAAVALFMKAVRRLPAKSA